MHNNIKRIKKLSAGGFTLPLSYQDHAYNLFSQLNPQLNLQPLQLNQYTIGNTAPSMISHPLLQANSLMQTPQLNQNITGFRMPETSVTNLPEEKSGLFSKDGAIGKMFNKDGAIGKAFGTNGWSAAGQGIDMLDNMLFSGQKANDSGLTQGIDSAYNSISNAAMKINPMVGGIMKIGGFVANGLQAIGGGTDQITTTDKIFDSTPGTILTLGLNGFLGKRTQKFSADKSTIAQVGGSYGGSVDNINKAVEKSNKKYGLFSSGARRRADEFISKTRKQQNTMADIAEDALDMSSIATNMSNINHLVYNTQLNGGFDQRYLRAAKTGGKISRIKKINFNKKGGTLNSVINLETHTIDFVPEIIDFVPEITNSFKSGGKIEEEFIPEIIEIPQFKEGGKAESNIKIEETSQKNLIPEGALHARKHHMENDGNITKKGIPVVDNDGEQQAEIELNEIIFTLEVTQKLEELRDKYKETNDDQYAIDAGKLLVEQILFNTDDRTGLIKQCKKGGVL